MAEPPKPNAPAARHGLTLFELLLVLAILALVGALAWPAMHRGFENYRLQQAADMLRAKWTKARVEAMDTGTIRCFVYQPEGQMFDVLPWQGFDANAEMSASDANFLSAGNNPWNVSPSFLTQQLPERVTFAAADVAQDARSAVTAGDAAANGMLTVPILFYPDGTSSDASVLLANEQGRAILIELRGITGISRVGRPEAYQNSAARGTP